MTVLASTVSVPPKDREILTHSTGLWRKYRELDQTDRRGVCSTRRSPGLGPRDGAPRMTDERPTEPRASVLLVGTGTEAVPSLRPEVLEFSILRLVAWLANVLERARSGPGQEVAVCVVVKFAAGITGAHGLHHLRDSAAGSPAPVNNSRATAISSSGTEGLPRSWSAWAFASMCCPRRSCQPIWWTRSMT